MENTDPALPRYVWAVIIFAMIFGLGYWAGMARVHSDQWTERICAWVTPAEDYPVPNVSPGYTCWDELHN
jgi:hypothetical protein